MRRTVVATALVAGGLLATSACGGHPSSAGTGTWGGYPTWLPSPAPVHQVLQASDAKPAYASQGDTVDVHLDSGEVLMTVIGPATPGQGLDPQPNATYCTFTVTVKGVSGAVPLSLKDFSTIDQVGALYALQSAPGSAAPPATVTPGNTSTFQVRTIMRTGEGLLHWEPGGTLSPVAWDFTVEVD